MGRSRRIQRINLKALIGTVVVVLVIVVGGLLTASVLRDRVRNELLSQSEALIEQGELRMAMRHLEQFLERHPDDIEILDRYTRLLSEAVLERGDVSRLNRAISNNQRLLRLDPEGQQVADLQQNRKWLAELYIRSSGDEQSRLARAVSVEQAVGSSFYEAAELLTAELIRIDPEDAEGYRLRGMAQEGLAGRNRPVDEAIESYQTALSLDPTDTISAYRLARLYRDRLDTPEKADALLDELVQNAPDSENAWLVRYDYYLSASDPDRASEALSRAAALAPDKPDVLLAAAADALSRKDPDQARALLDRLPEQSQGFPRVALLRAAIDLNEQRTDEAIAQLRDALSKARGGDVELVEQLAIMLIGSGDLAGARVNIERFGSLAGEARRPDYFFLLGQYHQMAGQHDQAVQSLNQAEDGLSSSKKIALLLLRADSLMMLGKRSEAIEDLRAAVNLEPRNPLVRRAMARALLPEGLDRAMAELREGLIQNPDSLELRRASLELLLTQQANLPAERRSWSRFDSALREAQEIEGIGDDPSLIVLEVQRLRLDGKTQAALARLEAAASRYPDNVTLWTTWSNLLIREGRREEALSVLERASAPEAAGDLASFRISRAQLLSQLGRGREAIELLAEAASTLQTNQRVQVLPVLGRMHVARGQFDEARAAYTSWKMLQPGSAVPLLALLELAIDTGDIKGAESALNELRGNPNQQPGLPYRLGLAEFLLRIPGDDKAGRTRRALETLASILGDGTEENPGIAPDLASALFLRGLAFRQLGELEGPLNAPEASFESALADLRAAWDRGERKAAAPMIDLLVRLDRIDEIDRLPRVSSSTGFDPELDRLTAEACLRHGRNDLAADYIERAGQAPTSSTPQFAAWRLAMYDRLGRTAQVEQMLRAQANDRQDAPSWITLIRYLAARGQRDAAEQAIAEMKSGVESDAPELLEAQAFEAIGDLDAADASYEAALEAQPDDPQVLLIAARFDRAVGRPREALERVERVLALDPSSRPASRFKALILADQATDPESWQAAWEVLGPEPSAGDPEAPADRLARAVILARHPDPSRHEEAVGRLEALIGDQPASDPMATTARESLARLLLQQGRADRAAEIAAVTAISSTNPAAVALYAQALIAANQLDEASRQLDRLRNLASNSDTITELELMLVEARAEAGSIAEELERAYFDAAEAPDALNTAAATFRRLVQLGDSAIEPTERVGRDLANRFPTLSWMPSQWFAAREEFPQALELAEPAMNSDDPAAAFQAARAVLTVIDRSRAEPALMDGAADLIERTASRHDLPAIKAILAMLRHFQGRTDPAAFDDEIRIYRELLQSEPDNVVYLNNLAWALSEFADEADEALELIDRALDTLDVDAPELLDTRGNILLRLDRLDEAIATLNAAVRERPNSALYHFHLARAYSKADQPDAARESIARALELGLTADDLEPFEQDEFEALTSS